jgi:hypothetical protein
LSICLCLSLVQHITGSVHSHEGGVVRCKAASVHACVQQVFHMMLLSDSWM